MPKTYCAIDFETSCNAKASACAVGAARIRDGVVTETFYSLIKPPAGMEILPFFTSIHGISNEDVKDAPTFAELWPRLKAFLGSDTLVAHNAPFDMGVLGAALDYYDIADPVPFFVCTVTLSRRKWPSLPNHKLNTMCRYLNIELSHHEALSDAVACAKVFVEAGR